MICLYTRKDDSIMTYDLQVTVLDPLLPPRTFLCKGRLARSLLHLINCPAGTTRMDAMDDEKILSLSQHVHAFRHKYGLEILMEPALYTGRDGKTWFGRYTLKSKVHVRHLAGGAI